MNWDQCFAQRTALMRRSAIRELMKATAREDVISFAGGLPAAELFPIPRVKSALMAVLDEFNGQALQYSATEGLPELRDWLARRYSNRGIRVQRENVLITTGGQQALDLIGRILLDSGDRVIVENPTYLALLSAWRPTGAEFLPVGCDADGMRVEELESLARHKPKVIYCVPNFQNPQGTTLSLARRKQLVELAQEQSVAIVEDDPYGELRYSGEALPNIADYFNQVIHVGTFSKVLMPGLRVGWVIAPEAVIEKLTQAKQSADLHTSTLNQHLALELAGKGFLETFLPVLRENYGERRNAMLNALAKYFPKSATWTRPEGGMFLLVTLPRHINTSELLPAALEQGVAYVPGEEFHLNGEGKNTLRLSFANARRERIETGIKTLSRLMASHV
ncbi:MAG TPA: PLP-dependent aminotransferase family protein [Verrucomicrobiae bacterium]|jgi:2-aminoadipate transaminase|nr:PLP-dependent aminotransferase family protein [Verrucomicrobiae bacterium]